MSRYWSEVVRGLTPYVPGEQPRLDNLIKLNTNENPYPPSPAVYGAIAAANDARLRLYPDPNADGLKAAIAGWYGLERGQVFVGNGSDEVLAFVFQGLLRQDQPLLFPDITYSFYPVYCQLYDVAWRAVPLDAQFRLRLADYCGGDSGGVILPNPNAPTGILLDLDAIATLATANARRVVVIDEAYIDFGGQTAVPLLARHPNLLITQTFSKSRSLAGLRVGFALGHPELIEGLERIKNSFNSYPLDRLAQAGAIAALEDRAHFEQTRQAIIASRERLSGGLADLGFAVLPSAANFVFARHPAREAGALAAALRERRIIVRHFKTPRIEQYLRITVGTDAECQALLDALRDLLA